MEEQIKEIIRRQTGIITPDAAKEITSRVFEFIEWKDNNTEPVYDIDNKIERYYCHFLLFESDDCKTLNDLYGYWFTNIKDK